MSLSKAELKYLQSLGTKKGRRQEKHFLCDGIRLLEEALAAGYLPEQVLYSPADMNERGEQLIAGFTGRKVAVRTISSKECHRLADTKSSQGVVGVFRTRLQRLVSQLEKHYHRILICDGIGDPGNLGTLLRSAAAFRFDLVITTAGSAEMTNPKTLRASMGAFFRVPCVENVDSDDLAHALKKHRITTYYADVKGKFLGNTMPVTEPLALLIGSEAVGADPVLIAAARYRIKIPMAKTVESLNAAMAGTVLMYWFDSRERKQK